MQGRRGKARRTLCLGKARGWLGRTLVRDDSAGKGKQADEEEPPHVAVVNRGLDGEMLQAVFAAAPGGVRKEFGRSFENLLDR